MKQTIIKKCQFEGCNGIATGALKIEEPNTGKEIDVCSSCYCGIHEIYCEENNCGDPAVEEINGRFVCKEHSKK